jgi:hypothetical protein
MRYSPNWDGQIVIYTQSKALFDLIDKNSDETNKYFQDFSPSLREEIEAKNKAFGGSSYSLEQVDIIEAIDWLQYVPSSFPITVINHTECNPRWNW